MREYTSKLIAMMDEGLISADAVAEMALAYMSEDDVKGMCLANDLLIGEDDEDLDEYETEELFDDGQPNEAQEWADFDPDC